MQTIKEFTAKIIMLFALTFSCQAIEGLKISLDVTNVVLAWPSVTNETFIIQHRATLDTNDVWETLAVSYPAEANTNWTRFVHTNQVTVPVQQGSGTNGGGGGSPPGPMSMTSGGSGSGLTTSRRVIAPPPPPALPPLPWESTSFNQRNASGSLISLNSEGGGSANAESIGPAVSQGFYRVVRTGVASWGLTNGIILTGNVTFPIELGLTNVNVITVNAFANGQALASSEVEKDDLGVWRFHWSTTLVPNGQYNLAFEVDTSDLGSFTNNPITVTVTNLISFPNVPAQKFTSMIWVYAQLGVPQAAWQLALYDDQSHYLGTFSDTTTDGIISFYWDLTDGNGHTFTNESFRGELSVTPAGASAQSSAPSRIIWIIEKEFGLYQMVVAYADLLNEADAQQTNQKQRLFMQDGVVDFLASAVGSPYTLSPGNNYDSTVFRLGDTNNLQELAGYLHDFSYRNFFFFGHGNAGWIGGDASKPELAISKRDMAKLLGNSAYTNAWTNSHPYRFVFFQGCETGKGDYCTAFGIPEYALNRAYFNDFNTQSRAFLGYKKKVDFNPAQWVAMATTFGSFWTDWRSGLPLYQCLRNAQTNTGTGFVYHFDSSAVIYGATNLTISAR